MNKSTGVLNPNLEFNVLILMEFFLNMSTYLLSISRM